MHGNMRYIGIISILIMLGMAACQKEPPAPPKDDDRLDSVHYCNDPRAINYNWDFPGLPDSTVCFFPTSVFRGTYTFLDSVLTSDFSLSFTQTLVLQVQARSFTELSLIGFCSGNESIFLTADRFFKAVIDTTIGVGQSFCRPVDTVSGFISTAIADTNRFRINFTVQSDTGISYHTGTAIRQ